MARSLKKGPFVHYKLDKKVQENIAGGNKGVVKTWSRASMITPDFVGRLSQFITVVNLCLRNRKHGRSQIREFSPTRSLEVMLEQKIKVKKIEAMGVRKRTADEKRG
jgi:small subunit ribosomal protein S19